jgi:hypothetical protein
LTDGRVTAPRGLRSEAMSLPGKELVSDSGIECRLQQEDFKEETGIECRLKPKNLERRSVSKIQNSFVLTARRGAAMLANPEKARAAPKDRVYRHQEALRCQPVQSAEGRRVWRSTADKASRSKPECPLDSDSLSSRLHDQSRIGTAGQEAPGLEAARALPNRLAGIQNPQ